MVIIKPRHSYCSALGFKPHLCHLTPLLADEDWEGWVVRFLPALWETWVVSSDPALGSVQSRDLGSEPEDKNSLSLCLLCK